MLSHAGASPGRPFPSNAAGAEREMEKWTDEQGMAREKQFAGSINSFSLWCPSLAEVNASCYLESCFPVSIKGARVGEVPPSCPSITAGPRSRGHSENWA